jgi:uncharacterized protein YjiS (DUF1127 family)
MSIETLNFQVENNIQSRLYIQSAKLLAKILSLVTSAKQRLPHDSLSDRDLADLGLRRWQVSQPDPRAPRLF